VTIHVALYSSYTCIYLGLHGLSLLRPLAYVSGFVSAGLKIFQRLCLCLSLQSAENHLINYGALASALVATRETLAIYVTRFNVSARKQLKQGLVYNNCLLI